jgi:hypothetical protein
MVGGVISRELLRPIFATAKNIFPGECEKFGFAVGKGGGGGVARFFSNRILQTRGVFCRLGWDARGWW